MPGNSLRISALLLLLVPMAATAEQSPPAASPPSPAPPAAFGPGVYIYPKNGQTQQQLWADRYACDTWSKTQSGFDPARPDGGVPAGEVAARRDQYRQAMTACLDAHGYGLGAQPSAASPAAATAPSAPAVPPAVAPAAAVAASPAHPPAASEWPGGLRYHPFTFQLGVGYSLSEGALRPGLDDGGSVGLGIHWFPSSWLPLGLRVDGSYSRLRETLASLNQEAAALGTAVDFGHQDVYGGDADLQLDLAQRSARFKLYLFGGAGWYRQSTVFKQLQASQPIYFCDFYQCGYGYFANVVTVARSTTPWVRSWNAGFGAEFALDDPVSFFIEARYLRLAPYGANIALVPINIGLRF